MTGPVGAPRAVNPEHDLRGVLRVSAFRRLWTALSLSSFGDWLGLLALTALAPKLAHDGYAAANLAIAGVFILRLAPAVLIGPLAGVVADRLDRRWTMVVCDLLRFALFLSIPVVGTLWWLLVATFLIEAASLMWIPAKEATLPNLVPRERLETANQLSLLTTYGSAPVAAAVFSGLALLTGVLDNVAPMLDEVYLALFFNAATFLVSALTILRLREIPRRVATGPGRRGPGLWRTLVEGWTFVGTSRLVRGLVAGMLGAFAAGGAVIGLARTFVRDLGGGEPGYGLLFGTVFCGLAAGMFLGPRLVPAFSRRRLLGLSLTAAGLALALLALIPHMVAAVLITLVIGGFAGVAWVTGYTLLGLEVDDALRGRTFALLQTMVRLVLVLVLAVAPLLAAAFGRHHLEVTEAMVLTYNGAAITMLLFGVLAAALGVASYRQMDDRRGMPLLADLSAAYRHEPLGVPYGEPSAGGFFIALEGGEGAGKSTQARLLAQWLEGKGHRVVVTFEPGGTELGTRLRSVLLDDPAGPATPSPRAEALLFAADRAQHVDTVIRPALHRGEVVISDRYVDSSLAYQGAGRALDRTEVARVSRWATGELRPHVTVLLDLPPEEGLRRAGSPDRLEAEPLDFHERVREQFLQLARRSGARHLVVDATRPADEVAAQIRERLAPMLPLSEQEAVALEEARRAEQEQRRAEAEERAHRQQLEAEERARRQQLEAEERVRREEERRQAEQAREEADRQQRREAAQARQREKAAREAEKAAREAEKARQRATTTEQQRAAQTEQQRAAAAAETARQRATGPHPGGTAPVSPHPRPSGPPRPLTGEVSLLDELLGPPEDDTLQLPQVREDR